MPNPTTGFESQFTPSFNWGNGFSSFDIATQQESIIIGKNPTLGAGSQFTLAVDWGNGFSSFDIATQQEILIVNKNPTLNADRFRKILKYDLTGKLTENTVTPVSQFQSYGRKFFNGDSIEYDGFTITKEESEYDGFGYTPAGQDGYLIKINSTQETPVINESVNSLTMAGTANTNKTVAGSLAKLGVGAAAGLSGIPMASTVGNAVLSQAGLLDPTYATAPLQNLNSKIAGLIQVPYPDFRTKKSSIAGKDFSVATATLLTRRIDGASAVLRSKSATAATYAGLAATIGPYNIFNLNSTYGWGMHDDPNALRIDFSARSNMATKWDKTKLKEIEKGGGARVGHALKKTGNILEKITPFRGDRVNVIDAGKRDWDNIYRWNPSPPSDGKFAESVQNLAKFFGQNPYGVTKDFIKFFFTGPNLHLGNQKIKDDVIVFRSTLTGFTDQFSPSWSPVNILGRPDPNYHYSGYTRNIDVGFVVYATDRDEMKYIYRKLNALAGYCAPEYTADSFALKAPWLRITIGDLLVSQPVIIDSLSYTFVDADSTWEINIEDDKEMMQAPHKIDVSLGLTLITDYLPQKGGSMYTLAKTANPSGIPGIGNDNWLSDSNTSLNIPKPPPTQAEQATAAAAAEQNAAIDAALASLFQPI